MRKVMKRMVYHPRKMTFSVFGKKITLNGESQFYEAGFHVFHNKEDAEKYIKDIISTKSTLTIKIMNIFRPMEPKSKNLVIKEVLVKDTICVGYQIYDNPSPALTTVARRMYVL
jgi:hypothetical protein